MTIRRKMAIIVALTLTCLIGFICYAVYEALLAIVFRGGSFLLGQSDIQTWFIMILVVCFLAGAVIIFLVEKMLLSRLAFLRESISKIGTGGDFSARVKIKSNDELSTLAGEINGMLTALEWSHYEHLESESRLRRITDNMLDMIAQTDTNWKYEYVSPSHTSILGYETDEMLKKSVLDLVYYEDRRRVVTFLQKALQGSKLGSIEFRCKNKKGDLLWIELVGNFLFDDHGRISGAIFGSRDITERRRAEEALRDSEEKYREIMGAIEEGFYEVDIFGNFTFFNDSLCRITGYTRKELLEKSSKILSRDSGEVSRWLKKVAATGKPENSLIWTFTNIDGSEKFVEVSISLIKDKQGNRLGFRGMIRDVTERRIAEEEIRIMNEELENRVAERTAQLEAANRELEAFSYSVSHDLRAPLRSIDGFSTAIVEDYNEKLDKQSMDYLQRIRAASRHMGQLIDDLLKLSRVTRSEMCHESVNLSGLVEEILVQFKQAEPERNLEFTIAPGLFVMGDTRLLRIMLENLLGNAWKFTSKNSSAKVEFGVKEDGEEPVYFVSDNGAGFEMAYADKLFGAFQRLHSLDEFKGTGIGLATVSRIVNRHGGRVWAEGAVEEGATFYFTL